MIVLRRLLCLCLGLVALSLAASPARAFFNKVEPGEMPKLDADEGLLVLAVDTPYALRSVNVTRVGGFSNAAKLNRIEVGRSMAVFRLKAGDYRWSEVEMYGDMHYDLRKDRDYGFHIDAGALNFPGELVFRPSGGGWARLHIANRSLDVQDWLHDRHAAVLARWPYRYSGLYPDPFAEFYRKEDVGRQPTGERDNSTTVEPWTKLPLAIEDLWRGSHVDNFLLSDDGALLAEVIREPKAWHVDLIDLSTFEAIRLITAPAQVRTIEWKGNHDLLIGLGGDIREQAYSLMHIGDRQGGKRQFERRAFRSTGRVLSVLPEDPGHVLFMSTDRSGELMVHRLDISSQKALDRATLKFVERLNKGVEHDVNWIAARDGSLPLAVARVGDDYVLSHKVDWVYREVLRWSGDSGLRPLTLAPDGHTVYCLTDDDREQRELVEFDLGTRSVGRTLFSRAGSDVSEVLLDSAGTAVGVRYYERGDLVSSYFDAGSNELQGRFARSLPGRSVFLASRDHSGERMVIGAVGSDQPLQYYLYERGPDQLSLLDEGMPWLKDKTFGSTRVIAAKSTDGLAIEAFLTLPPKAAGVPLVVMPHGGPIDVRDSLLFDPEVQFLVSQGFGVLQVNFRGSEGYGKAFRLAGNKSYGTRIEDDIDAALAVASQDAAIDGKRMCMLGASYGGFSALISAIRWPQRFRCVVSMSGVTDRPLRFTASDGGRNAAARAWMEKAMGDPNHELEAMMATSPLYRYRELTVPTMFVHGDEDFRVDYEHTRRMVRMLDLAGRPPALYKISGGGHGGWTIEETGAAWTRIATFLHQHLDP